MADRFFPRPNGKKSIFGPPTARFLEVLVEPCKIPNYGELLCFDQEDSWKTSDCGYKRIRLYPQSVVAKKERISCEF